MKKNWYQADVERSLVVAVHKTGLFRCQLLKQFGVMKSSVQKSIEKIYKGSVCDNREKVEGLVK